MSSPPEADKSMVSEQTSGSTHDPVTRDANAVMQPISTNGIITEPESTARSKESTQGKATDRHPSQPYMHRALSIPEILLKVFQTLDQDSNVSNARVCRLWRDFALDQVWRVVGPEVFQVLGSMQPTESGLDLEFKPNGSPSMRDWWIFSYNAHRVRHFTFPGHGGVYGLTRSALLELASTRPFPCIFPFLTHLSASSPDLDVMFMTPSVRTLELSLAHSRTSPRMPMPVLLRHIPERMPFITTLILHSDTLVPAYPVELGLALMELMELRRVALPLYTFSAVCGGLAVLPHLVKVSRMKGRLRPQRADDLALPTLSGYALHEGSFPSLIDSAFSFKTLHDARNVLANDYFPTERLMKLKLHVPQDLNTLDVPGVLFTLSRRGVSLRVLVLEFMGSEYRFRDEINAITPLTLDSILPVTSMPKLREFTITHPHPIRLSDSDIDNFTKSNQVWSQRMTHLYLNPHPLFTTTPTLTLNALKHLQRNCPRLQSVGLYVDASDPRVVSSESVKPRSEASRWRTIWLDSSPLPDKKTLSTNFPPISRFLAQILHPEVIWRWRPDLERDDEEKAGFKPKVDFAGKISGSLLQAIPGYVDVEKAHKRWKIVEAMTRVISEERRR